MKKQNKEITLKDIFDIFIPKLWIILIVALVCAVALSVVSIFKKPTYTSSSMIYVQSQSNNNNITAGDITIAEDMVEVYRVMLYESDIILGEVVNALSSEYIITSDQIRSMLSIEQMNETPVLRINVTSGDEYLSYRVSDEIYKTSQLLPTKLGGSETSNLTVVPVDPPIKDDVVENSKNIVRNAIVGFLAGTVVTMLFIWIYSMLDVVIRTSKKIEEALDIPVLAVIPRHDVSSNEEAVK